MSRVLSGRAMLGLARRAACDWSQPRGPSLVVPPPPVLDHFHLLLLQLNGLHVNTALEPGARRVDVSGPGFKSASERGRENKHGKKWWDRGGFTSVHACAALLTRASA